MVARSALLAAALLVLAGCASPGGASISAEEAKQRALASEEEYVRHRLQNASGLDDWGTTGGTVTEKATVVNQSDGGYYVRVVHPYWFTEGSSHADLGTRAVYYVDADTVRRVEGSEVRA